MARKQSIETNSIPSTLIAPCGMNCRLCRAYVRDRNVCPGCRSDEGPKSKSCRECSIKNCERIVDDGIRYCFECVNFPCMRMSRLDKRYRTRYGMSMIENLNAVREQGVKRFLENQEKRWACPACGKLLCVHKSGCIYCEHVWR